MAKREKYIIWGRESDTKKGCYQFYQNKKKSWPLNYVLNTIETKHMIDMMSRYYYSPMNPELVQDKWNKVKDKIIEIKVTYHEIYGSGGGTRLEFWVKKPTYKMSKTIGMVDGKIASENKDGKPFLMETVDDPGEMHAFSVARCICFKGNGLVNESEKPKPAVLEALKNAIADDKIGWKKSQGYRPGVDPIKHAHHVDGKEFKTIYNKFLNEIKMSDDEFIKIVYPLHGDFEGSLVKYADDGTGWRFKNIEKANVIANAFWEFHYRNREYELVDPAYHRDITSNEIKFNTSIRNKIKRFNMKWNKQFEYPASMRSSIEGKRHYEITGEKLPSVTTILGATQSDEKKESIAKWTARVGEDEAIRVRDTAASRGTNMHLHLERHILGTGHKDLTDEGQVAGDMAQVIINKGLCDLSEIWGSEVTLFYPGLYAGATDLVGIYDYEDSIIDFKQSNRPKRREWIDDYFMQLGAYAMAHNCVYDTEITQGVILMCTPDKYFQKFQVKGKEFIKYQHKFLERLDKYYSDRNKAES